MTATESELKPGTAGGVYVYGVTWSGSAPGKSAGIGDARVSTVEHGELAAIASRVAERQLRGKRRDLLRHSDVLQEVFDRAPVLPLRFGTVLESEDAVIEGFLGERYEELVALLQRFEGLAELRLRAAFPDKDRILAEIVRSDRRVTALRDATRLAAPGDPRHVQLGELVAHLFEASRLGVADEVVDSLGRHARDVRVDERRDELDVIRASFLTDRGDTALERAAEKLAERHAGRVAFELIGPMPPHSFVAVETGGGHRR